MLDNLLRPFVLARLIVGGVTLGLVLVGVVVALDVLRRFRPTEHGEAQLALERRGELASTALAAATVTTISGLLLTVVGADRAAHSIRGAMCAFGTLASTPGGFVAVGISTVASVAFSLYAIAHRLDHQLTSLSLTKPKFALLLLIAPLALIDFAATAHYLLSLDFTVIASCCSSTLDAGGPDASSSALGAALLPFGATLAVLVAAAGVAVYAGRHPGKAPAALAAGASLLALAAAASSVVHHVAPHVYGTPNHRCPFCLLHADAWGIGWPLLAAALGAAALGPGLLLLELLRAPAADDDAVDALARRVGHRAAFCLLALAALCAAPIARYYLTTGATLFGQGL
jgi:hypothetical protein